MCAGVLLGNIPLNDSFYYSKHTWLQSQHRECLLLSPDLLGTFLNLSEKLFRESQ